MIMRLYTSFKFVYSRFIRISQMFLAFSSQLKFRGVPD